MPIQIIDNFDLRVSKAIDNRFVVGAGQFYTNKDNIDYKYPGLRVWDLDLSIPFVWTGATWSNETTSSVTGNGTVGTIPKFIGSTNNIGDSVIKESSSNIGIGGVPSSSKLKVYGNVESTGTFIGTAWSAGTGLTNINLGTNGSNVTGTIGLTNLQNGTSQGRVLISGASTPSWTDQVQIGTSPSAGTPGASDGIYLKNSFGHIPRIYAVAGQGLYIRINATDTFRVFDGSISVSGGSVTTPALRFGTDSSSGIYSVTSNQIGFSISNSNRLTISSSAITPTIPIRLSDGTTGSPSLAFSSDTDTGIWRPSSGKLAISANSTKMIEVSSTSISFGNPNSSGVKYTFDSGIQIQGLDAPISANVGYYSSSWRHTFNAPGYTMFYQTFGSENKFVFYVTTSGSAGSPATLSTVYKIDPNSSIPQLELTNGLKYKSTISFSVAANTGTTYTHGLGYIPIAVVVCQDGNVHPNITLLDTTQIRIYNFNTGSNTANGTIYLW